MWKLLRSSANPTQHTSNPVRQNLNRLQCLYHRKINTYKKLQKYKHWLQPGVYFIDDNLASRLYSPIPTSLSTFNSQSYDKLSSFRTFIVNTLHKALPPSIVPVVHQSQPTATHLLDTDGHGDAKIFDTETHRVLTFFSDTTELTLLQEAYSRLDYFPLPKLHFRPQNSPLLVEEEYIPGRSYLSADRSQRLSAWIFLGDCLKNATRFSSKAFDDRSHVTQYFHNTLQTDIPDSLRSTLCQLKPKVIECIAESATVWGHGDMYGENVLVTNDGPVVIDIFTCCKVPLFYDLMNLLANDIIQNKDHIATKFTRSTPSWRSHQHLTVYGLPHSLTIYFLAFLVIYLGKTEKTEGLSREKWKKLNGALQQLSSICSK